MRKRALVSKFQCGSLGRLTQLQHVSVVACSVVSPNLCCAKTVPEPYLICPLGLAFERKQMPQVNENTGNRTKRKEALERWHVLAKQVLSQLSYTPTKGSF
jgi:hypothetical protein